MKKHWSIDRRDWDNLPKEILEGNWKVSQLGSVYKSKIPKESGIYMTVVSIPRATSKALLNIKSPMYVGLSKNLQSRFGNHLTKSEFLNLKKCFKKVEFYYLVTPEENIDLFEQHLIDCFGPLVNKRNSMIIEEKVRVKASLSSKEEKLY